MLDIDEPVIVNPNQVKIKIAYASICGSDLHFVKGEMDLLFKDMDKVPLGHEISGYVTELGSKAAAKGLKVGDRVTYYYNLYCGNCYYCRNGQEHLCSNIKSNLDAMAEYIVVDEQQVHKIPYYVDMASAVYIEPVSVCLHGIDLCRIKPGARVAITGGGGIGLILLQLAKAAGATGLTLIEPIPGKRELALKLGADYVLDPFNQDIPEEARKITDGLGFDVSIEASGSTKACRNAYDIVGRGGLLEFFAALYDPAYSFPLSLFDAFFKEITIVAGVFQSPYAFPRSIALFKRLDMKPMMENAIFPVEDYQQAFDAQINGKTIKSILKF